jgi:hypothetical protein
MNRIFIAGVAALFLTTGTAQAIEYPYREDGPKREWYIQSGFPVCIEFDSYKKLGDKKEVSAFCICKGEHLADSTTAEDVAWWRDFRKRSAQMEEKAEQAEIACKHHFSKLPKIPERKK